MSDYIGKKLFIGIDAHKNSYTFVVLHESEVVKKATIEAKPELLVSFIKNNYIDAHVYTAYEADFSGFHLHRHLARNGINNIIVHPAHIEISARLLKEKGPLALKKTFQSDLPHKNRTAKNIEKIVLDYSLKNPHLGQAQILAQLKANYDIEISPAGVRCIWLREDMNTCALRLLKAKSLLKKCLGRGVV